MELTKAEAHNLLDRLFRHINPLSRDSKCILVKVEDCTLYIPVPNLDESQIPEFREQFTRVYEKTQE